MTTEFITPAAEPGLRLESHVERHRRVGAFEVGVSLLALAILASVVVRVFGLVHPDTPSFSDTLAPPSLQHWFGTDELGRDVFGRTVYATLLDLQVGVITTVIPLILGVIVGAVVGYVGGLIDSVIMRVMDVILAFPFLVFVIAWVAIYGPGLKGVYIGLVVTALPVFVRLSRADMLALREQQFMMAAQTLGFSRARILVRHALPHVVDTCLVYSMSNVVYSITSLVALSYLGLGVQPPTPEWGVIIADGQQYLLTNWWLATLPGLFVVVVCIAIFLTGEGLADKLRGRVGGAL